MCAGTNHTEYDFVKASPTGKDPRLYQRVENTFPTKNAVLATQMAHNQMMQSKVYGHSHAKIFENYPSPGNIYRRKSRCEGHHYHLSLSLFLFISFSLSGCVCVYVRSITAYKNHPETHTHNLS